ncbi:metallophosphoesterase family protein [Flammeovirgaceae bacterium SG7u.111]|nr:metallophosphoesterase family protein [Flammeovirgaceae bacterium SG7u.132]WPO33106.1 metallophosphoesterase family protein [Flammeovirgaceae bacterium SG7u.111]
MSHNQLAKYTYSIPEGKGRRFVVPDVHGCRDSLLMLIHNLKLKAEDQLFFLGDYVDRGPDSAGVIDLILKMKNEGFQVFPLRGNHEQMLLNTISFSHGVEAGSNSELEEYLDENGKFKKEYLNFLNSLPYYFELEDFFLVHAGFNTMDDQPFTDYESMIWIRDFYYDKKVFKKKKVLYGHTPTRFREINENIMNKSDLICLDNGCVFSDYYPGMGKLLCLELNSMELIIQENVDWPYRIR